MPYSTSREYSSLYDAQSNWVCKGAVLLHSVARGGIVVENNSISSMLGLRSGDVVSIVGAGGKTTTMYRSCAELRARGLRVISTTTTAIQRPTSQQSPLLLIASDTPDLTAAIAKGLEAHGHVTVVGKARRADKFEGVSAARIATFRDLADVVVIEADGARHAAIKVPAEHEPAVPTCTTVCLSVSGLHALGRPLGEVCHRSERAAVLTGESMATPVSGMTIARLLASHDGGLRGVPMTADAWAVLTHLQDDDLAVARDTARALQHTRYRGIVGLSRDKVVRLA